jgi:hypothetical protein
MAEFLADLLDSSIDERQNHPRFFAMVFSANFMVLTFDNRQGRARLPGVSDRFRMQRESAHEQNSADARSGRARGTGSV